MKLLLVHPGASWAVHDVWKGAFSALERAGVEVVQYALDGRINYWQLWFQWLWKRNKRQGVELGEYSESDVLFAASQDIVLKALHHRVDWVLLIAGTYVHPEGLMMLRRAGVKLAVILTESPYSDTQEIGITRLSNVVWTNERASVPIFSQYGEAHYWQHAMDPERHGEKPDSYDTAVPEHDVVFVGTGFEERVQTLSSVNWDGIDFGLYGSWTLLGSRHPLRKHLRAGVIDNRMTAALYRKAKIGLNLHRTSVGWGRNVEHIKIVAESMNPRCYELAACGRFFISDYRAEVSEVFGGLVPTFETAAELEALLRHYLADDQARIDIAAQLPEAVKPHTFDKRISGLLEVLSSKQ
ncbi:MAG: glycosyltransferase [Parcubacteria group bacterium]